MSEKLEQQIATIAIMTAQEQLSFLPPGDFLEKLAHGIALSEGANELDEVAIDQLKKALNHLADAQRAYELHAQACHDSLNKHEHESLAAAQGGAV